MRGISPVPREIVALSAYWRSKAVEIYDRFWAGKRLIDLPIPDTQHENPRGVDKGRLLINI
jgi:hypothetical protein